MTVHEALEQARGALADWHRMLDDALHRGERIGTIHPAFPALGALVAAVEAERPRLIDTRRIDAFLDRPERAGWELVRQGAGYAHDDDRPVEVWVFDHRGDGTLLGNGTTPAEALAAAERGAGS